MRKCCLLFLLLILSINLNVGGVLAQDRQILYSKSLSSILEKTAKTIQDLSTQEIPYADLIRMTNYFVRIAPRQHILTESNELKDNAILGTKPFIFLTTPESVYGKSLLEIYLDIGYEAEDIIRWQRNEEMVTIVFRYPESIKIAEVKDGKFQSDWNTYVYVPTWGNIFSLFYGLARNADIDPNKSGEFAPEKIFFRSRGEQEFILGFPDEGKKRVQTISYANLRSTGGADWVFRELLERKLSIFEHFRGNGRTLNEIVDPSGVHLEAGLLEFVGPNMKVRDLPELAIIDLGKLTMEDTYTSLRSHGGLGWVAANNGQIPGGAVEGGYEQPPRKEILYICRARYNGGVHPGKIRPGFSGCNIGWGGQEQSIPSYEVLVHNR